jgi:hypothetical protein
MLSHPQKSALAAMVLAEKSVEIDRTSASAAALSFIVGAFQFTVTLFHWSVF